MPLSPTSWPSQISNDRQSILRAGLNILSDPYLPLTQASQTALTSGQCYAMAVGLRNGDVVANVIASITTAAAGAVPTLIRLGLADSTGKMLAVTADVKSDAQWTALGLGVFPLSAAYTVPADGLFYLCIIEVGAFGGTPLQVRRQSTAGSLPALTGGKLMMAAQTGLTDLPTVGNSLTLGAPSSNAIYLGCN